jgi:hypothetical protein
MPRRLPARLLELIRGWIPLAPCSGDAALLRLGSAPQPLPSGRRRLRTSLPALRRNGKRGNRNIGGLGARWRRTFEPCVDGYLLAGSLGAPPGGTVGGLFFLFL